MTIEDTGGDALLREVFFLEDKTVEVGFLDGNQRAEIAGYQQFGTRDTPSRPFMSIAFEKNSEKLEKMAESGINKILSGSGSSKELLQKMGKAHKDHIQKQIQSNTPPPNAPSTVAQKGHGKTLIDTGKMLNSVEYEVK